MFKIIDINREGYKRTIAYNPEHANPITISSATDDIAFNLEEARTIKQFLDEVLKPATTNYICENGVCHILDECGWEE